MDATVSFNRISLTELIPLSARESHASHFINLLLFVIKNQYVVVQREYENAWPHRIYYAHAGWSSSQLSNDFIEFMLFLQAKIGFEIFGIRFWDWIYPLALLWDFQNVLRRRNFSCATVAKVHIHKIIRIVVRLLHAVNKRINLQNRVHSYRSSVQQPTTCTAHIIQLINLDCLRHLFWFFLKFLLLLLNCSASKSCRASCPIAHGIAINLLLKFMNKYFSQFQIVAFMFAVANKFQQNTKEKTRQHPRPQLQCENESHRRAASFETFIYLFHSHRRRMDLHLTIMANNAKQSTNLLYVTVDTKK